MRITANLRLKKLGVDVEGLHKKHTKRLKKYQNDKMRSLDSLIMHGVVQI